MDPSFKSKEERRAERERQLRIMRTVATELEPSDAASVASRGSRSSGGSSQTSGSSSARRSARPGSSGRQRRRSFADATDDILRDAGMPVSGQTTGRWGGTRGSKGGERGSKSGGAPGMMPRRRSADVAQAIEDATASGALGTGLDALDTDMSGSDRPSRTAVDQARKFLWDDDLPNVDLDPLSDTSEARGSRDAASSWRRARDDVGYVDQSDFGSGSRLNYGLNTGVEPHSVPSMYYDSPAGPFRGLGSKGSSKSGVTPYGPPPDTLADRIQDSCDVVLDCMSDGVDSVYYQFGGCLDYGRRHIWKVVFLLAAVTVIVGASVALTNRKVGAGDSSRGAPAMVSMAGPIADGGRYKSIKSRIIKEGVSSSRDFGNGSTAQSRALYWISEADELQIPPDDPHMAERYTLAVFYFMAADSNLAPDDSGDGERRRRLQDGGNEADVVLHDSDSVQELTGWRQVSNWMSEKGHCSWHGVECHINGAFATHYGTNGITVLNMTNNRIEGMLPKEFGALKDLRVLDLSQNKLKGSIPSALGKAMELVALHLGGNVFTGTIPSEIGQLSKCTHLYLDENELEGSIPSEVTTLSNMQMIGLHVNALTGEIPDFSAMQELRALYVDSNHLSSTIPSTLGALGSSLLDLRLGSNDITGSLPSELGNLSSLRSLHVEENDLSGSLPLEFAGMDVLNELHAYGNKISGSIPIQIGFLGFFSELKVLYLDGNEITGTIPPSVSNMKNLVDLYLHHNKLEGTLPDALPKLPALKNLRLNDNNLSGTIPADFDSLTRLEYLYLHNNLLEGTIPDELGALTTLFRLRMYGNSLRGTIPRGICHLRDLYLEELEADCDGIRPGIECTCCTACF
mmetsp:Transcript_22704/g.49202  ORF Transcript_22704/g.49202 Transcript_22704/m.49202 type:complete len:856 (-) Transcript_22704:106-2673(-)